MKPKLYIADTPRMKRVRSWRMAGNLAVVAGILAALWLLTQR